MKILIATGIYPPKVGGPAQYAKNLKSTFEKMGHTVRVQTYGVEEKLPTGIRHLIFFFKIIPAVWRAQYVLILDTFSVGLPTVFACKILGKKCIIRTGGDFLWEQYVERVHKPVLLRDFYKTEKENLSFKERWVFKLTRWTLQNSSKIIFSTVWQRDIFLEPYALNMDKTCIIENYYGPKEEDRENESNQKIFITSSRGIFLKNEGLLRDVFRNIPEAELFRERLPFGEFMKKLKGAYAVIVPSLSEISPNIILDAIRFNRPFICTREVGIYDRIKEVGLFVNPLDKKSITDAVRELLSEEGYKNAMYKVKNFNFLHSWEDIAQEFLDVFKKIQK